MYSNAFTITTAQNFQFPIILQLLRKFQLITTNYNYQLPLKLAGSGLMHQYYTIEIGA